MSIIFFFISYIIGSIPTAFWLGKLVKGVDIRQAGSGNVGATNAFRVLGKGLGISVLVFDIFKGLIVTAFLPLFLNQADIGPEAIKILLGFCAIAGHNWSLFLRFKGGKGMATSLGVLLGLAIGIPALRLVLLLSVCLWLIVFLISGFVSLASLISALTFPILSLMVTKSMPIIIFSLIVSFFAIFRHKSNIHRLLENKESRLRFPWLRR